MADGSLVFDTKLDSTGLQKGLSGVGNVAKSSIKAMTTALAAAGTVVAAGVAASIKFGKEYETSMAKVQTMFGDVDVDMDNLNQKMLAISSSTGLAATELGQAMYSALSAGIPVTEDMTEATGFLEGAVKLAKAGFTDVDTAVSATAKTLNAYNLDVSEAERIQGILMATQNNGITTVGELGATLAQVTPVAASMGVQFEYVGAALATMTAQGTPTAQATTQLKSLFAELGKNGTIAAKSLAKAVENTEYAGMSFTDMTEAGVPLNEILSMMTDYAEANNLAVVDMFGSIEAGQAVLALTGESADTFSKNIAAMSNTAGLVDSAYDTMQSTLESKVDIIRESAKNLGISVYNGMKSKLSDVAGLAIEYIEKLQTGFDEGGIDGLVAAFGDVLADMISRTADALPGVISVVVGLINALISGFTKPENKTKIATGLAKAIEAAFTLAESVPDLVDAGLSIMTELMTQIANNADTTAPKIIKAIGDALLIVVDYAPELLVAGIKIAVALIKALAESVPDWVPQVVDALCDAIVVLVEYAPELIAAGFELAKALITAIINSIPSLIGGVIDIFTALFTNKLAIDKLFEEQFGATQAAYESFKRSIADADKNFDNTVLDAEAKRFLAKQLLDDYDKILGKYNGEDLTEADKTKLQAIVEQLLALYPELNGYVGDNTLLLDSNTGAIRRHIDALADEAISKGFTTYFENIGEAYATAAIEYKKAQDNVSVLTDDLTAAQDALAAKQAEIDAAGTGYGTGGRVRVEELKREKTELEKEVNVAQGVLTEAAGLLTTFQEALAQSQTDLAQAKEAYTAFTESATTVVESGAEAGEAVAEYAEGAAGDTKNVDAQTEANNELAASLDAVSEAADGATDGTTEAVDTTVTEAEKVTQTVATLDEANTLIESIRENIISLDTVLSERTTAILATVTELGDTITEQHDAVLALFEDMAESSQALLVGWMAAFYAAGYAWSSNLAAGILNGRGAVVGAVKTLIAAAIVAARGVSSTYGQTNIPGYAKGLEVVPYDNYLALLHKGERVLTAAEARVYNSAFVQGGTTSVNDVVASVNRPIEIHNHFIVDGEEIATTIEPKVSAIQGDRAGRMRG